MKILAASLESKGVGVFQSKLSTLLQVVGASLFIGLCAQYSIPLPFTPIPLAGSTLGVLFVGALLGSRKGALAVLLYLVEGCLGLPVWAGGAAGFLHLMGPTGGYRLAYVAQAYLVGWFIEKQSSFNFLKTALALFLACWIQMALGSIWLAHFVGLKNVFLMGFLPFLPGEAIKVLLVTTYLKSRRN